MKSKASLFLMEQLVMLLVFSLAAAVCLGIFVRADKISVQTALQDEAVILAQNTAEALKHTGNADTAKELVDESVFTLEIREEDSGIPGLTQAQIVVCYEGREIFSLRTGWQEVGK